MSISLKEIKPIILGGLICVSGFFIGCDDSKKQANKQTTSEHYNYSLNQVDSLKISIDAQTHPIYYRSQYLPKKNQLIIADNPHKLLKLNLDNNSIVDTIKFQEEGVNDVKDAGYSFYYHNKDSIFLVGQKSKIFFLVNAEGEVQKSIRFENLNLDINDYGEPMLGMGVNSGVYQNGVLSVITYPTAAEQMKRSADDPVYINYDINENKLRLSDLKYEYSVNYDVMQHPYYIHPKFSYNSKGNKVVLFPTDNHFLIIKDGEMIKKKFTSDFFSEYEKMNEPSEIPFFELESYANEKLLFNEESGRSYLFISHKIDHINEDTGEKRSRYEKPFSVLVFDKDFNKILEKKFPGGTYNINSSFISNDHLYLSLNNPENERFNEDFYKYELYEINKKDA